jgi:hypothetical protein
MMDFLASFNWIDRVERWVMTLWYRDWGVELQFKRNGEWNGQQVEKALKKYHVVMWGDGLPKTL